MIYQLGWHYGDNMDRGTTSGDEFEGSETLVISHEHHITVCRARFVSSCNNRALQEMCWAVLPLGYLHGRSLSGEDWATKLATFGNLSICQNCGALLPEIESSTSAAVIWPRHMTCVCKPWNKSLKIDVYLVLSIPSNTLDQYLSKWEWKG